MKKLLLFLSLIVLFSISAKNSYSQRVLINETFETSGLNADSLPTNWIKYDEDGSTLTSPYIYAVWSARDSGSFFPGVNGVIHSRAHTGHRGMNIPWRAGVGTSQPDPDVANDWVFMDSTSLQTGDSLIFWCLMGSPADINLQPYIDSLQIHIGPVNAPVATTRIATIVSNDTDNVWTQYKFSLNAFANQGPMYIAFRYNMNTSVDGVWCNLDDIFVGNHSAPSGVSHIGTNVPTEFALKQNYPNPFNPTTKIKFDIAKASNVRITVFNEVGQEVSVLQNGFLNAGFYETDFNGKNLASGTYFYRIEAGNFVQTKKLTLVK